MRKDEIRQAVRQHLAMCGYPGGHYAWQQGRGGRLRVMLDPHAPLNGGAKAGENPMRGAWMELRIPAGKTSRKALKAALATIPVKGPATQLARERKTSPQVQAAFEGMWAA